MVQAKKTCKKLYRSYKHRMIAGVCAGLAQYFNIDENWIRLLFVFFLLLGGSAILIYVVMWVVVPLNTKI